MISKRTKRTFIRYFKYYQKILFFITLKITAYRKFFISFKMIFIRFISAIPFYLFRSIVKLNILKMTNNAPFKRYINWKLKAGTNFLAPIVRHHNLLRIKTGRSDSSLPVSPQPRYSVNLNAWIRTCFFP